MDTLSIVVNPAIQAGVPCIAGSRVPVLVVAQHIWSGLTHHDVNNIYPLVSTLSIFNACWFQATYGERVWDIRWGKWARSIERQLSDEDIDFIAPPPNRFETTAPRQILSHLISQVSNNTRSHGELYL